MTPPDDKHVNNLRPLCSLDLYMLFLGFHASNFPEKSETQEPGKIIMECTSYDNQTTHNAENSRQQAPHEAQPSLRRHNPRDREAPTVHH